MIKKQYLLIISLLLLFAGKASGQKDTVVITDSIPTTYNVFEIFQSDDSIHSTIKIYQDKRIETLFMDKQLMNSSGVIAGYRVQVFSSNMHQTAKNEAFRVERLMTERFPNKGVYVTYTSPFWKVRMGDFRTLEEAREFRDELSAIFPSLKKEMYVVRDQINLAAPK